MRFVLRSIPLHFHPLILGSFFLLALAGHLSAAPKVSLEEPGGGPVLTGTVVAWGSKRAGQTDVPAGLGGVKRIAAGGEHTLAVKADGTVLAWGRNVEGQTNVPAGLAGVQAVAAGNTHSLALKTDGTVVAWGNNFAGKSDVPVGLTGVKAIAAGADHSMALKNDGTVVAWGNSLYGESQVPAGLSDLQAISCGAYNNLGLKTDGTVVSWNYGMYGEQNVPPGLSGIQAIAKGWFHSVVAKADGSVIAWGKNTDGQCVIPPEAQNVRIVAAGIDHTLAIRTDGSVVAWGLNTFGQCNVPVGLRGVRAISGGGTHSVALLGSVSSLGAWASGTTAPPKTYTIRNTGNSPLNISGVSVSGEDAASFVVDTSGMLSTVPSGGQTAFTVTFTFAPGPGDIRNTTLFILSNDPDDASYEVALSAKRGLPEISMVESATTPLSSGAVVGWGLGTSGQTTTPAAALSGVVAVAAAGSYSLGLKGDHTVVAWGSESGGLTTIPIALQGRVNALAASDFHCLALDVDGNVTAWGNNDYGQTSIPAGLTGVTSISAGFSHSVAAKSDGTVVAWGRNNYGQQTVPAGLSGVKTVSAGGAHSVALKTDGTVVAWGNNADGQRNVPAGLSGVQAIAAGGFATSALKSDGTVVSWGSSTSGGSAPAGLSDVIAIAAGQSYAMALKRDSSVVIWGGSGTLNIPAGLTGVKAISAGSDHVIAITDSTVGFGNYFIGSTSPPKTFTIRNTGHDVLHISSVSVIGGDAARFTLDTTGLSGSILPGGETTFTATFSPSSNDFSRTTLRVLNDDPDESVHDIVLSGTVIPEIAVFTGANTTPANERADNSGLLAFPDTPPGGTSAGQIFTIRNTGTADLTGISISILGTSAAEYHVNPPASSTLAAGDTTTFSITFSPAGLFERNAIVSIASNDLDENPFEIPVTGKATAPEISLEDSNGSVLEAGRLVAWGRDEHHQTTIPTAARFGIKEVALGNWHSMGLKNNGTLIPWGEGSNKEPTVPAGLGIVKAIAAGLSYNVAIKENGSLFAWGTNFQGQTNIPSLTNARAVSAGVNHGIVLRTDGTVTPWGSGNASLVPAPSARTNVKAIAAGYYHNLSLKNDGTVVSWGANTAPSTAYLVPGLTNILAVSAGNDYSLALKADGTVWHWTDRVTPVKLAVTGAVAISAGGSHYAILKDDGTVLAFGSNTYGQTDVPAGLGSVTSIKAGDVNTMAIINGRLDFGNRAIGSISPTKTVVIKNSGNEPLHITGVTINNGNAPDFPVDTTGMLTTVPIGGQTTFSVSFSPTANGSRTATLRVANDDPDEGFYEISLVGASRSEIAVFTGPTTNPTAERVDNVGTEVFPDAPAGTIGTTKTFTILSTNDAALTGLAVSVAGMNPADFTVTAPVSTSLPQGQSTTFTVTFSPKANGLRTATISIASNDEDENPFEITFTGGGLIPDITIGQPNGILLPPDSVITWGSSGSILPDEAASLTNVLAVSQGGGHTLVLKADGTVLAWGDNMFGQCDVPAGLGGVIAIAAGQIHSAALKQDGTVVTWGDSNAPAIPAGLSGVKAISANNRTAALKTDGTVVVWGRTSSDRSAVPEGLANVTAVSEGYGHRLALKSDGTVVAWGTENTYSQLTVPAGLTGVKSISAGYYHNLALKIDGTVVAWGKNNSGQATIPAGLKDVKEIVAGYESSFALKQDGSLVIWGASPYGATDIPPGLPGYTFRSISAGGSQVIALGLSRTAFEGRAPGIGSQSKSFTISNDGPAPLDISSISLIGENIADFTLNAGGVPAAIAPGAQAVFTVSFTPGAIGPRASTLRILSNDPDENPTDLEFTGTGFTPAEAWRQTYFGNPAETGERANLADFDHDGISNLLEYAFGTNPTRSDPADGRLLATRSGDLCVISYRRPAGGSPGITYGIELANSDMSTWIPGVSGSDYSQTVFTHGDGTETVTITLINEPISRRFARIRISN